jgi:hypothetical protein
MAYDKPGCEHVVAGRCQAGSPPQQLCRTAECAVGKADVVGLNHRQIPAAGQERR